MLGMSKRILLGVAPACCVASVLWLTACAPARRGCPRVVEADAHAVASIPFVLNAHNNILVRAKLNGRDVVDLMLHTAASGVFLIEGARAKTPSVRYSASGSSTSWGGRGSTRVSAGNRLSIAGLDWQDVQIIEDKRSGRESDGKFGLDLFGERIVEIDFEARRLRLHDALPSSCASYARLPLTTKLGSPFVEASITVGEAKYSNAFMLHSGFRDTLLCDDAFVARAGLRDKLEVLGTSRLRDSMGNVLVTRQCSVPRLTLGPSSFAAVPVAIFEGRLRKQGFSVLGCELLRRFHWFLDLERGRCAYCAPNRERDAAFPSRQS